MAKKVVQLHHASDIANYHYKKMGGLFFFLALLILYIGFTSIHTTDAASESRSNIIFLTSVLGTIIFLFLSISIFKFFVEYRNIEFTSDELVLVSPPSRFSLTRYEYRIRFDHIEKILFNYLSSYVVTFDKESIDELPPPIYKRAYSIYNYMIPLRLIKDQSQEKNLWKAFDSLNRYYNESGKDYVIYNPPTMHYQRKFGANKIRNNNHDGVIFLVKKYQGE